MHLTNPPARPHPVRHRQPGVLLRRTPREAVVVMARHYGALPPPDCGDIEDCGNFCVWWYGITDRRTKVRRVEWAYAWRSACGTYWRTSSGESGYATRDDAIGAATTKTEQQAERRS